MVIPSPFVYWAQTEKGISLKIDLKSVQKPNVSVLENSVKFSAQGIGAHGDTYYEFNIQLYSPIETSETCEDAVTVRVFENRVDLLLQKVNSAWWPRLTAQPQKPAWLKINFDLWKIEGGDSEEDTRDVMQDYPGMYDRLQKEEMGFRKEDFKKVYLTLYNLFQFVGFMYVMCVMVVRYLKLESESFHDTYEHVGPAMKFLQLIMYLEVMHPIFGYIGGSPLIPFLQVSGRAFILFAMIDAEPRMQTKFVVSCLFFVWTLIEIIRYPFYIAQLYKKPIGLLTWLRYTMWIPLYPLGVLFESTIVLRNIPYFEETNKFTISLPNEWNFAFHMPTFLRVYLLFLTFPGLYLVMGHMYRLRKIKLRRRVVIKKAK